MFISNLIRFNQDESNEMIPREFTQSDRRERSLCLVSRPGVSNPAPQSNHGSPCPMANRIKRIRRLLCSCWPAERTHPEYEFYAKYHAPITEDSCDTQADAIESMIATVGACYIEYDCINAPTDPTQSARDTTSFC